jgi:small subunit ribosomal protein S6
MFILDSNRYARDPSGVSGQLTKMVEKHGGEMLVSRMWAEQKLAYPIDGHRKGTYWLTYFRMDSGHQKDLLRDCRLNENILRNLILQVDARLVDTLVEHAQAGGRSTVREEDSGGRGEPEGEVARARSGRPAEETADEKV